MTICVPAPRHANLFPSLRVPRTPNFNPATSTGKPSWMADLPMLSAERVETMDEWYRARVRCMQSIDEMVEEVVEDLEKAGELDNTYIVFTSDNGFHLGHFRLGAGKMTGIEEDIRVVGMGRVEQVEMRN
jgi:arylsulfatase A-like enzyme